MDLVGRSAVVAGGAGGIGAATVRRLAGAGVGVVVVDPDERRSAELVADHGGAVVAIAGTTDDDATVARAIGAAQELGIFSIAISATGVVIPSRPLVDADGTPLPLETLRANLDLHVYGPFNLARLAAAAFAANEPDDDGERGVIVQTASIGAFDGQVTMVPYSAAKGAIVAMTLTMARDLAAVGVRVCAIAPGPVDTPRLATPVIREMVLGDVVFPKRLGRPEEYALLAEQIVRNPYLNGEVIRWDGAARMSPETVRLPKGAQHAPRPE